MYGITVLYDIMHFQTKVYNAFLSVWVKKKFFSVNTIFKHKS